MTAAIHALPPAACSVPARWQRLRRNCFLIALLLLVFPYAPLARQLFPAYFRRLERMEEERIALIKKERERKRMTFILVEESPPEEVEKADLEGATSRKARDMIEKDLPDEKAPSSEGPAPMAVQQEGRFDPARSGQPLALAPERPRKPTEPPSPRPTPSKKDADKPQKDPAPPAPQETRPATLSALPEEKEFPEVESKREAEPAPSPQPTPPPKPLPEETARNPAEEIEKTEKTEKPAPPIFRNIGSRAAKEGQDATRSRNTSARLKGNKSFQILMGRYPKYMAKLQKAVQQQINAAATVRDRSYRTGRVILAFGIRPGGELSKVEPVDIPEGMQAERVICESALRGAAPFDPLTPEMMRDIELFRDIGFVVYFY